MTHLFEYHTIAEKIGVSSEEMAKLEDCLRRQYGCDEMLFELRMLRTLEAIAQGATTLQQAILELIADPTREFSTSM